MRQQGVDLRPTRRYLTELGYALDPRDFIERSDQRLSTLCYVEQGGQLLMLHREKEPFAHHWTAPGGKIEDGESPLDAVVREVREETNLTIYEPQLKAVCSESGEADYNWLLFVFRCTRFSGEVIASDEGEVRWLPVDELDAWRLPSIDRHILTYVLNADRSVHFMRVTYTEQHDVEEFTVRPLEEM